MSIFSQLVHKHHIPKVFIVFFLISITSTFASYNGIVKAQESDTIICTDTAQEIYGKNDDVKQAKDLPLALKNINKDLLEAEKMYSSITLQRIVL